MKLIDDITVSQVHADSKNDYVFDLHIAQRHNTEKIVDFASDITKFFKQSQANEFLITASDVNSTTNYDNNLIAVTKTDLVYSVTTAYEKEFSAAMCYDANGILQPSAIAITFGVNTDTSPNRQIIIITVQTAITSNLRIVLI